MSDDQHKRSDILGTNDKFIAAVPWGERRVVLVFRREHGGRTYVRVRTWNRHRTKRVWYPTERFYVIPVDEADSLAEAIRAAARDEPLDRKPPWYAARERRDLKRLELLEEVDAPVEVIDGLRSQIRRRKSRQ